ASASIRTPPATPFRKPSARAELTPRSSRRSRNTAPPIATSPAPPASAEDRLGKEVIDRPFLVLARPEPLRLQIEHRLIASALRHQLVVRPALDHLPVFEHAAAIGL